MKQRLVTLVYLPTEWQVADLFTKGLGKTIFTRLSPLLMGEERMNTGAVRAALAKIEREAGNRVQQVHMLTGTSEEKNFIGVTDLHAGHHAWSIDKTHQAKQRAQNGHPYPNQDSIVAVSDFDTNRYYHHLTCSALHYYRDGLAFHSGVRITTTGVAHEAGFSTCNMCVAKLHRRRGG